MNHVEPFHGVGTRTLVSCTLLLTALGAGVAACSSDDRGLSAASRYDAADQIAFNGPAEDGRKADPDKPLEVTAEDDDGRITDVTAAGRHGPLCRRRTLRRRHPLAQHLSAGRRRPLHGPGEHRGRGRGARPQDLHLRPPASPSRQEAPGRRLRARSGHVRRRPAHHRQAERARQGQGAAGRRRTGAQGRLHPRRAGRLALGGRQGAPLPAQGVLARPRRPARSAATWRASRSATGSGAARPSRSS